MQIHVFRIGIGKDVTAVTDSEHLQSQCEDRKVIIQRKTITVSSLLSPRGSQNLCEALFIHRVGNHTQKKAESNMGISPKTTGGKSNG